YNILKRKVDSDNELYQGMLQRMKEAQVSAGLNASNIRIVDAAIVPKGPVKPRITLNLALGLILGLGLGVGLAFFQEYLDKTLKTSDDVERLLRLPSLGILPKFSLNGHGLHDGLKSEESEGKLIPLGANGNGHPAPAIQTAPDATEAFRSLRTSILLSASPVPKLLLITSALPSEGKTTTALNLGATLASLNTNVVVVDCDMRRPAVHRSAGVENKPGFVQCLTGHVKLEDAVLPVPGVPNLSVIPCGPIPPNPAEILSSRVTGELLRKLREMFEFVLVDSPPILSVADSRILATLTDAAILVTRAHSTPYDVVRRARSLLYGANSRILGVALNDVDLHRDGYYGYSGGNFGYGYGYGYGHANKNESGNQESADKLL
ncbi:MAG: polysaccharide biosynthesis tyrosine autokinase, partial [Terriglobia bacterium]